MPLVAGALATPYDELDLMYRAGAVLRAVRIWFDAGAGTSSSYGGGVTQRPGDAPPPAPTATELEVGRVLVAALEQLTGRREPNGKVALLESAAELGVSAEDLGTFVALVSGHPWSLAMSACRDVDDLVRAWPALAATGSSHNLTEVHHDPDRSLLMVRRRRSDGGPPGELEDRFVLGLVRGFLQGGPGTEVLGVTYETGPDDRTWRMSLAPANPVAHTSARWGAVGPVSGAVLEVFDHVDRVDVHRVSAALAMSSRTLQRRLAAEDTTFRDIRQRARLAAAARAVTGGANLTDAAHEAGFADSAHLSREFRRLVGVQPAQWRRWSPAGGAGRERNGANVQGGT